MTTTRPILNQRPIQVNRRDQPQVASSSDQSTESTGTMPAVCPGNKKKTSKLATLLGGLLDSRSLPVENDALKKVNYFVLINSFNFKKRFGFV